MTADSPPALLLAALRSAAFGGAFFISEKTSVREKQKGKSGLMQRNEMETGLSEEQKLVLGTLLVK